MPRLPTRHTRIATLAVAVLSVLACRADAEVTLGSLFTDHMVLQRDAASPIWGTAKAGDTVSVSVNGNEVATATADASGAFKAKLPKLPAGGPHTIIVKAGEESATLNDVLTGDVWIASGQSNMQWGLDGSNDAAKEIAEANYPNIRLYDVPRIASPTPLKSVKAKWTPCTPETARGFSAVAYFFGRHLQRELNVPIGLLHTSWGGTPAEAWTPLETMRTLKDLPQVQDMVARRDASADGGRALPPATQPMPLDQPHTPATLYNGMIAPLGDFGMKGAIWYQGESNVARHEEYRQLMTAMIGSWREQFAQGDFPFYIVGLANFLAPTENPNQPTGWAQLRQAQRQIAREVKNTAMTVTIDIGDAVDIHPRNKQDVGRRLALVALADTYGKTLVSRGPTLKDAKIDDGQVTLTFDHIGGGLKSIHEPLEGFAVSANDNNWFWATAKIMDDGRTVVLSSPNVPKPTQVHYGWADNPKATLFNAEGLPAEPFEVKK